jgi:hypothetical protein
VFANIFIPITRQQMFAMLAQRERESHGAKNSYRDHSLRENQHAAVMKFCNDHCSKRDHPPFDHATTFFVCSVLNCLQQQSRFRFRKRPIRSYDFPRYFDFYQTVA